MITRVLVSCLQLKVTAKNLARPVLLTFVCNLLVRKHFFVDLPFVYYFDKKKMGSIVKKFCNHGKKTQYQIRRAQLELKSIGFIN